MSIRGPMLQMYKLRLTNSPLRLIRWLLTTLLLSVTQVHASEPVEAVALFKDRAVVRTAAGQEMLKLGQTSSSGVTLLKADTKSATVRFEGKTYTLSISGRVASSFSKPAVETVRINRDSIGQYRMRGAINGHYVNFLIDTGASIVALSERHAVAMGLDFRRKGVQSYVQTAQGNASSYSIVLDVVTLGGISRQNVGASVIEGNFPVDVLLGMTFLGKVNMQDSDGVLTITSKY